MIFFCRNESVVYVNQNIISGLWVSKRGLYGVCGGKLHFYMNISGCIRSIVIIGFLICQITIRATVLKWSMKTHLRLSIKDVRFFQIKNGFFFVLRFCRLVSRGQKCTEQSCISLPYHTYGYGDVYIFLAKCVNFRATVMAGEIRTEFVQFLYF